MSIDGNVFSGCIPALMTPCDASGRPDFDALADKGKELVSLGMNSVVYCGSMGDWPLLTEVVGTGAQSTKRAASLARHASEAGAVGLMVIPRVLSRGSSVAAQRSHFLSVLDAANGLPAVIYNSPYYGFETRAELFFELRSQHDNLVGFKEFGGADSLTYAAENITSGDPELTLMIGVDTQVVHGFVRCGARGAITGVGNALPTEILRLVELCRKAAHGDHEAYRLATELDEALAVLSRYDEGPDLVLYYKHLMVLEGSPEYAHQVNPDDKLSPSQKAQLENQWRQFRSWWAGWPGTNT
jgi:4-hydroxy-tetrahydrodipicolinate synthase